MQLLDGEQLIAIRDYENNLDLQKKLQEQFRELIETRPLYSFMEFSLPPLRKLELEVARLQCHVCQTSQPFRPYEYPEWKSRRDDHLAFSSKQALRETDLLQAFTVPLHLECQECKRSYYYFFLHVDPTINRVVKFGQFPQWVPPTDKELMKAMGPSFTFYQKAMRCMNESYGIGACAYFRRMIESYINPLLQLLLEYKQDAGGSAEELSLIEKAINGKDFAGKIEFAGEICPESLIVGGANPIKRLHSLLSYNIHQGTDKEAMEIALKLKDSIEYVIPELRRHHERRRKFIESTKELNQLDPSKTGIEDAS